MWATDPATGARTHRLRPEEEWVSIEQPQLPVVPNDHWDRVQSRFTARKGARGRAQGTGTTGHLLTGLLRCGDCGSTMRVVSVKGRRRSSSRCASASPPRRPSLQGLDRGRPRGRRALPGESPRDRRGGAEARRNLARPRPRPDHAGERAHRQAALRGARGPEYESGRPFRRLDRVRSSCPSDTRPAARPGVTSMSRVRPSCGQGVRFAHSRMAARSAEWSGIPSALAFASSCFQIRAGKRTDRGTVGPVSVPFRGRPRPT